MKKIVLLISICSGIILLITAMHAFWQGYHPNHSYNWNHPQALLSFTVSAELVVDFSEHFYEAELPLAEGYRFISRQTGEIVASIQLLPNPPVSALEDYSDDPANSPELPLEEASSVPTYLLINGSAPTKIFTSTSGIFVRQDIDSAEGNFMFSYQEESNHKPQQLQIDYPPKQVT